MKTLFHYNQRLVETVEQFIVHEKRIVDKYNVLSRLYMDSFQKYCSSKNMDLNFNVKPLKCVCDKVKVGDWKFDLEDQKNCLLYTSPSPRDKRQSRMPSSA